MKSNDHSALLDVFSRSKSRTTVTNDERVLRAAYRFQKAWPNKDLTHGVYAARCRSLSVEEFRNSVASLVKDGYMTWMRVTDNGVLIYELTALGMSKGEELDIHFVR